jgi:hypothetical protein
MHNTTSSTSLRPGQCKPASPTPRRPGRSTLDDAVAPAPLRATIRRRGDRWLRARWSRMVVLALAFGVSACSRFLPDEQTIRLQRAGNQLRIDIDSVAPAREPAGRALDGFLPLWAPTARSDEAANDAGAPRRNERGLIPLTLEEFRAGAIGIAEFPWEFAPIHRLLCGSLPEDHGALLDREQVIARIDAEHRVVDASAQELLLAQLPRWQDIVRRQARIATFDCEARGDRGRVIQQRITISDLGQYVDYLNALVEIAVCFAALDGDPKRARSPIDASRPWVGRRPFVSLDGDRIVFRCALQPGAALDEALADLKLAHRLHPYVAQLAGVVDRLVFDRSRGELEAAFRCGDGAFELRYTRKDAARADRRD